MIFVAIGIVALLMVAVFAVLALTDADAEQGPPPTLRPVPPFAHELDSGLGAYADAAYADEWDQHVAEALDVARDDFDMWAAELNDDRRRA